MTVSVAKGVSVVSINRNGAFGITVDGGGSAITSGEKGFISIPYNGTISGWEMYADQAGDCIVDIWKVAAGDFPPDNTDSITASAPPTLSSQQSNSDTTLTGWTTTITEGDIIAFNVDSATTVTRINLIITTEKSYT